MGFTARKSRFVDELRLNELALVEGDVVDMDSLKKANLISREVKTVKVFASGTIEKAVTLKGIKVTRGARAAIEAAGGKIEE
jgi:large subunit ribosomal protein L15